MIISARLDPDRQPDDEMVAIRVADTPDDEGGARYVVDVLRGRASDLPDLSALEAL